MTNSLRVARRLEERCEHKLGGEVHKHVILENGRTSAAQKYPPESCKKICRGIQDQIIADRKGEFLIGIMDAGCERDSKQLLQAQRELREHFRIGEEEEEDDQMKEAFDDLSGARLDPVKVQKAS